MSSTVLELFAQRDARLYLNSATLTTRIPAWRNLHQPLSRLLATSSASPYVLWPLRMTMAYGTSLAPSSPAGQEPPLQRSKKLWRMNRRGPRITAYRNRKRNKGTSLKRFAWRSPKLTSSLSRTMKPSRRSTLTPKANTKISRVLSPYTIAIRFLSSRLSHISTRSCGPTDLRSVLAFSQAVAWTLSHSPPQKLLCVNVDISSALLSMAKTI
ncbi:hypothetical protein B0H19DRAFT_463692 [Mycena capillaripes]|nr:hypothetical protein B0H19DRAFT_463692 [Mycena capillaripes]